MDRQVVVDQVRNGIEVHCRSARGELQIARTVGVVDIAAEQPPFAMTGIERHRSVPLETGLGRGSVARNSCIPEIAVTYRSSNLPFLSLAGGHQQEKRSQQLRTSAGGDYHLRTRTGISVVTPPREIVSGVSRPSGTVSGTMALI